MHWRRLPLYWPDFKMPENHSTNFFILFRGDIIGDSRPENVKNRIARLFSAPVHMAAPFFNGDALFFRTGMDLFTAKKYYKAFEKAGARAYIGPDTAISNKEPDPDELRSLETVTCTRCSTEQTTGETCVICSGILKQPGTREDAVKNAAGEYVSDEILHSQKRARRIFQIGGFLLLIIYIFDENLREFAIRQASLYLESNTPSIGFLPHIAATLIIFYGCIHFVRVKGYPAVLSLVGLTNILGLGILVLLPNRCKPEEKRPIFHLKNIGGVVLILLSVFWAYNVLFKNSAFSAFLNMPQPFLAALESGDGFSLQPWPESLVSPEKDLRQYIENGYNLLSKYDFDIAATQKIADRIYFALSNMSIWLYYQQYLFIINDREIPDNLSDEAIEEKTYGYVKSLMKRNQALNNGIVYRSHQDWIYVYHRENDPEAAKIRRIADRLQRWAVDVPIRMELEHIEFEEIAARFDSSGHPYFADMQIQNGQILIRFRSDIVEPIAGKTIRFASWYEETYRGEHLAIRRTGGNIEEKYFGSFPTSVLKEIGMRIVMEKIGGGKKKPE